jgi:hypothetical protein
MANEFTMTGLLKIDKGFQQDIKNVSNLRITQIGDGSAGGVQNIGTSAEAIDLGDVSTLGLYFFRNLDPIGGNFVEIGQDSGGGFEVYEKLLPGEFTVGRFGVLAGTLQAKADTAAIELQYKIYEA